MISHKHKCIFIHIPKCAGSSIETAFGVDVNNNTLNEEYLFGWDSVNKLYLQHATPQQLIDFKLISEENWNAYYKFIIVRNTWDKAMSDYFWFKETKNFKGSFKDYLYGKNDFVRFISLGEQTYRGDHLTPQIEYMFLNNKPIKYNRVIYFDKHNLNEKLVALTRKLELHNNFFEKKVQVGKKHKKHYSKFYTNRMKNEVFNLYKKDIEFFNFSFKDKKNLFDKFILNFN